MKKPGKLMFKRNLKNYTLLFLVVLLLFSVVVAFIKTTFGTYTYKDFINDLFNSLMGAIIPLILFNILFEYLMRDHQSQVVSEAIAETLLLNDDTLNHFSPETRKTFIKNAAQSLIGKEEGEMLYSTLFSPYLSERQKFRRNFKYYIFNMEFEKLLVKGNAHLFDPEAYIWVIEELSYEKSHLDLNEEILVGFSYNEQRLESYFKNDRIIFRENMAIHPDQIAMLRNMDPQEWKAFVSETLQFSLEINGEKCMLNSVEQEENGFILRLTHPGAALKPEETGYCKLKVAFQMPQLRSYRKFVLIISEPTYGVDVLYSNQLPGTTVTTVPFFDQDELISTLPNELTRIELKDWVLPTSGAVFVWEEKGKKSA